MVGPTWAVSSGPSVEYMNVPVVAGVVSTVIFALSAFPMLVKAARTKELQSYSLSNMLLTNAGNAVHSVYVFSLPPGPIWAMHSFYLVTTATMLVWYVRYSKATAAGGTGQKEHALEALEAVRARPATSGGASPTEHSGHLGDVVHEVQDLLHLAAPGEPLEQRPDGQLLCPVLAAH